MSNSTLIPAPYATASDAALMTPPPEEGATFAKVFRMVYVEKREFEVVGAELRISQQQILGILTRIRDIMGVDISCTW